MNDSERIVTKVSRDLQKLEQLVRGNGSIDGSILGRVKVLEEGHVEITKKPYREICLFEEWQKKDEKMKEKRRAFRSADIANWLTLLALAYLIISGQGS